MTERVKLYSLAHGLQRCDEMAIGAPLSHAAIVARELGIPAVVGCGNATSRLRTGDSVIVDGGKGVVHILN